MKYTIIMILIVKKIKNNLCIDIYMQIWKNNYCIKSDLELEIINSF